MSWSGKVRCSEADCTFVLYVEGEPTEAGLNAIVALSVDLHVATNHPDLSLTLTPQNMRAGSVVPPDGAYDAPMRPVRTGPKKLQN